MSLRVFEAPLTPPLLALLGTLLFRLLLIIPVIGAVLLVLFSAAFFFLGCGSRSVITSASSGLAGVIVAAGCHFCISLGGTTRIRFDAGLSVSRLLSEFDG